MSNFFCITCGHLLKETTRFCPECGSVREESTVSSSSQKQQTSEVASNSGLAIGVANDHLKFLDRAKTIPKPFVAAGAVSLLLLLFIGLRITGVRDSSMTTTPPPENTVTATASNPTPVNRFLELGQIESACGGSELWWNESSVSFEFKGDSSSATLADAWKYRGRENLVIQCGVDSQVSVAIVLKIEPDRLRLVASESAAGTFVERASDTVVRVGVSRSCCYPDVPLETASVFRFQYRGQIEIDTRAIVRFDGWDVANWRCKSLNEPVWGDGEDFDGFEFSDAESGYLTVCSESSEIFDLQEILVDAGYDIGIDGQFGPGTLNALLNFAEQEGKNGVEGVVLSDGDFRYARRRG